MSRAIRKDDSMAVDGHLNFDTKIDESGFNVGIKKLGSIAKGGLTLLGGAVAGVAAAIGTASAAAIKVGSDFEAGMSKVSAISGATGSELEALTEKAKEMGAKTKFSATESAEAFQYMAMAGWKIGDMLDGIEGIMNLAAASGEDLATTSDIVTDALTAFGLSAKDSTHFADILAKASSNANTNVSMMGETFKYVAPVAGSLGFSAEDCATAIGLMANSGIKATQAGTALRSIFTRMAKPTDEVASAMSALGLSITNNDGSMKSLNEIMVDMRGAFAGLTEQQKAQMAASIGGQEAMSGLLAIVNASDDDVNKLSNSIANCDGASADMAATMNDNLQGALALLRSAAEGLGIEIYESIQTPLKDIVKVGADSISQLTEAFQSGGTEGLIEAGGQIIANLLTGIAGATPKVLDISIQIIQSLVQSLSDNMPQMSAAGAQIVTTIWHGISELLPMIGNLAYEILTEFLHGIVDNAPTAMEAGTQFLVNMMNGISSKLPELVPLAFQALLAFAQGIVSNLPALAEAGLNMLVSLAQGIANSLPTLIEQVPRLINEFCDNIDTLLPQILLTGLKIIGVLGQGIIDSIPTIIENAGEIVAAILNVITHLELFSAGVDLVKGLCSGIKSVLGSISGVTKKLITQIKSPFKLDWSSIGKNIVTGIAKGITGAAGAIANAAKAAAKNALKAAKSFLGIHSPSTVFRDQVGKYMALGMGEGFEENLPINNIGKSIDRAVHRIGATVDAGKSEKILTETPTSHTDQDSSGDNLPKDVPIVINNTFEVDGTPLVKKTTKAVIKQVSNDSKSRKKVKG